MTMQEPVTVQLGTSYVYKNSGAKQRLVERKDLFQYVPLFKHLAWLLQNVDIYNEVREYKRLSKF